MFRYDPNVIYDNNFLHDPQTQYEISSYGWGVELV
jgi:hypothetical protein